MDLDKDNNLNNTPKKYNEKLKNQSDLADNFSEHNNSELIEKEYEALPKTIENLIKKHFLKKEFYENLPDWSNLEIDNICNHSAVDVANRIKEWKWILYMNPCITQTLYFINILKEEFPHLSKNMDLCIEILKLLKLNIDSVHTFIKIKIPNHEPIIIDFAHDNDVYIYQWEYTNKASSAIRTKDIYPIPVNSFTENDTIFNIAMKGEIIKNWDFNPNSQELNNDFFSWILNSRKEQLKSHNTKHKFELWQERNKEIRIFNSLHK